jgi:hypothetical protein
MVNSVKDSLSLSLFYFYLSGVPVFLTYLYTGQQHVTIEVCTCTDFITTLLHNKLWPATPVSPGAKL